MPTTRKQSATGGSAADAEDFGISIPQTSDEEEVDISDRLKMMVEQAPGEKVKVKLYRLNEDRKVSWCTDYTPQTFEDGGLDLIRKQWGSGTFEIRIFSGKRMLVRQSFEIEAMRVPEAPQSPAIDPQITTLLAQLAQGQQQLAQALAARPDPMAEMERMASFMRLMREVNPVPAPVAPTAPAQSASAMLKDMLESMALLKDVAKETAAPAERDDPLLALAGPALNVISQAMSARQGPQALPAPFGAVPQIDMPASIGEASDAAPINPAVPATNSEEVDMQNLPALILKGYVLKLVKLAKDNATHDVGAEYFLSLYDKLPDDVAEAVELPNWFELLAEITSEVTPYQSWFEAVHALAMQRLDDEDTPASTAKAG